jgi:hypothetical protein
MLARRNVSGFLILLKRLDPLSRCAAADGPPIGAKCGKPGRQPYLSDRLAVETKPAWRCDTNIPRPK